MSAVDVILAVIVIVPLVTALMAVFAFIIGVVVVSIRGGVEGAYEARRHREAAHRARADYVERCTDDADGRENRGSSDPACRPSPPAVLPPRSG